MRPNERNGFSLIELLVVVAIIGILAAMAIWSMLGAIQRAKQKRTMSDMRTIAVAWEARGTDSKSYNAAGATFSFPAAMISFPVINGMLVPTYLRSIPQVDGWDHPFQFATDQSASSGSPATLYAIRSSGRDGIFSGVTYPPGATTNFDCDIVYSSGAFISYPEGIQGK